MSLKSIECYELHSSILDIALETVFSLPEAFGVKTQACKFLCGLTENFLNSEDHLYKETIIKAFFQFGILSAIKNQIYENSGPPPSYFAVLITLLNNILVLETKKVLGICIQIDVWDGIIRLLRPGALEERANNEIRKPCKPGVFNDYEEILITLISFVSFFINAIRTDLQILDFLLESSHFLSYLLS